MACQTIYTATAGAMLFGAAALPSERVTQSVASLQTLPAVVKEITPPDFAEKPAWYEKQLEEEQATANESQQPANNGAGNGRVVTYTVSTKGATSADLGEFSAQVNETLNSPRGWARMGISFQQVSSGGNFNLILSEPALVPSFSPGGCSAEWSCRVGVSVIINDMRWTGGTDAWNASGASIRDYRHMVVNHEVGHWLGHGHQNCSAPGASAAVMQQQSISLQGCAPNPWPHEGELWSSQLGIGR